MGPHSEAGLWWRIRNRHGHIDGGPEGIALAVEREVRRQTPAKNREAPGAGWN